MKTVATNPTTAGTTSSDSGLIKDAPVTKPPGKAIGELVAGKSGAADFSVHESHWRENHAQQKFAQGKSYGEFSHAYRTGYEGYSDFGKAGSFEETETKLRERYETEDGSPKLPWNVARPATHAAWHRAANAKK